LSQLSFSLPPGRGGQAGPPGPAVSEKFEFEICSHAMSSEEGIKVYVRVRPPNEREKQVGAAEIEVVIRRLSRR
jgi:hypothetical protein